MKIFTEVKPGVFEVRVGSKIEIAYGNDAMYAAYRRMVAAAAVTPVAVVEPSVKRAGGRQAYGA